MNEKIADTLGKINQKLLHQRFYNEISLKDYEPSKSVMTHSKTEIATKVYFNQYLEKSLILKQKNIFESSENSEVHVIPYFKNAMADIINNTEIPIPNPIHDVGRLSRTRRIYNQRRYRPTKIGKIGTLMEFKKLDKLYRKDYCNYIMEKSKITIGNPQKLFSNVDSHCGSMPNYFKSISVFYEEIMNPMSEKLEELSNKTLQDYEDTLLVSAVGYYSKFEKLIKDYLKYKKQNRYERYIILVLTFLINMIKSQVHFAQRTKDIRRFHESSQDELIKIIEFIENNLSPEQEIEKFS